MSSETDLVTALKAAAGVDAIIAGRIFPLLRPQGESLPALVYERISTDPVNSLQGSSGLDGVQLRLTSWAPSYKTAQQLATAVRAAMAAAPGFKSVYQAQQDSYDKDVGQYGVVQEYRLWQK